MASNEDGDKLGEGAQVGGGAPSSEPAPGVISTSRIAEPAPVPSYWVYDSFGAKVRDQGTPISAVWRIHYCASSGELTVRTVEFSHVFVTGNRVYLHGHCRLRGEARSFDVSRIHRAYDMTAACQIADVAGAARQFLPDSVQRTRRQSAFYAGGVSPTSSFSERLATVTQKLLAELKQLNSSNAALKGPRGKGPSGSTRAYSAKPTRAPKVPKAPKQPKAASQPKSSAQTRAGGTRLSPALRQSIHEGVLAHLLQQAAKVPPPPPPLPSEMPWYDPSDPDDSERQARWARIKAGR